jgi:5,10-methylenetetrahydrofolate reductase
MKKPPNGLTRKMTGIRAPLRKFREAVQGTDLSISAELSLRRDFTASDVHRQVDTLGEIVDGIQVTDNPWLWVQMSAVAAASLVLQKGIDPIPLLTCRDRNRIALQSDLLGLRAMGVSSVLLVRGQKETGNHQVKAATVADTSDLELVAMARALNDDPSCGAGEDLFIGTGGRVFRAGTKWQAESLQARADAGARFLQTQLCMNTDIIRAYIDALVRTKLTWKYAVIISLTVLPSAKTAIWLKKNMRDTKIPVRLVERLQDAADAELEGIKICAELMQEISEIPGVSGINLMTMGNPESIPAAIRASGLRS